MAKTSEKSDEQPTGGTKTTKNNSRPQELPFHIIKKALDETYDRVLSRYKDRMDEDGPYSLKDMQKLQGSFDNDAEWNAVLNSLPGNNPNPAELLADMAGLIDINEKDLSLIASLRPGMLKALSYAINEYNSAIQEFGAKDPDPAGNRSLKPVLGQYKSGSPERSTEEEPTKSIQDLIDSFIAEKKLGKAWTEKSSGEIASILGCMRDILHALEVQSPSDLSFGIARAFKDTLIALPANPTQRKTYLKDIEGNGRGQAKIQGKVAQDAKVDCISITTVNKYLIRVNALMDYALKHGFIDRNFFVGLSIKQTKRKSDTRKEFQPEQVQIIIKAILERSNIKGAKTKPFHRWLPLLGIYTGARLNELCQIYLDDINEKDGGITCICITDKREDQRLKNLSSEREIPIHPELKRLGFMEFVQEQRDKGENRLFPELPHGRDGYSKNASKWFASFRREILPEANDLVFHSFRHTAATEMKRKGVQEGLAASILGHSVESMTYGHYGKGYTAQQLLDALTEGLADLC